MYEKMYYIMFWTASDAMERLEYQEFEAAASILEQGCRNAGDIRDGNTMEDQIHEETYRILKQSCRDVGATMEEKATEDKLYEEMYRILCRAVSDAMEQMERREYQGAMTILERACRDAEEIYVSQILFK